MKHSRKSLIGVAVLALMCAGVRADAPQSETSRIVAAANAFLDTLDAKQKSQVMYAFNDEKQRARWSNLPTRFVSRGGLSMGELSDKQRAAAMGLLTAALSKSGFEKVQQIMQGDELLKDGEGNDMFGKDLYYISFLGSPSEKEAWMLQFGGHHLGLNMTIVGEQGALTPSHVGAQPALYQFEGKTVRPLGNESDKALALLNSLDEAQKKQAILNYRVADLVLGPGKDGQTIQPEGLKASSMDEKQQAMLLDLISEWSGIENEQFATARMQEIKADLNETWFAWSGPTTVEVGKNVKAYFRVQGPKVVIEYAPQRLGGDLSLHVHTIYRDPTNDYGRRFISK